MNLMQVTFNGRVRFKLPFIVYEKPRFNFLYTIVFTAFWEHN